MGTATAAVASGIPARFMNHSIDAPTKVGGAMSERRLAGTERLEVQPQPSPVNAVMVAKVATVTRVRLSAVADEGAQPGRGAQTGGAVGLHRHPDDADEGEGTGLLVARGGGDEGGADPEAAEAGDVEREHDERDHDGVTVGATDEVHDDERVEDREPEGLGRVDPETPGEARQGPGQQRDGGQRRQAHEDGGEVGVVAGDRDDGVLHLERERAVGRRSEHPHRVDLVGELTGDPVGAVGVGVEAALDDEPLRGVAVGVAAEERRSEQDRQAPEDPGEARHPATLARPHAQPGVDEQRRGRR